jgi:hypothetical protein
MEQYYDRNTNMLTLIFDTQLILNELEGLSSIYAT